MGQWFTRCATCIVFILSCFFLLGNTEYDPDPLTYEVKPGDTLYGIAAEFGNFTWWSDIYKANADKIENPRFIYPGQTLEIPTYIVQDFRLTVTTDDVDRVLAMSKKFEREEKEKKLKKFRKAFNELVEKGEEKKKNESEVDDYEGLGLGGMILDETRSKMGSNFYSVFYKHWEDPKDVQNFTITVSEQPMPSRGTMVQVEIDNQLVFKNRLEPRYYKTQQAAKQAVKICQRRLQRIATTQNEFAGY
ncbi:CsgE family curli-type amyloid fiber assembly protein [Fodinibius sp. AD559]|uniref:CsgE family curli-type amyloid fiber assembly protein n=1 Tax=Fodinibius sp. AD559 TaxID=3424179 RepID=UPI004046D173